MTGVQTCALPIYSQLVIGQVNGTYEAKEEWMKKYLNKVRRLIEKFGEAHFVQVPREENMKADTLAKEVSVSELTDEFDEIQYRPSMDLPEVQQIEGEKNWMTPIVGYLKEGKLTQGRDEACKLRINFNQVYPNGRGVIQERFFPTLPEVVSSR